jgi:enamine deaminase RidA (YjgF/YER057c/UK114 family)
VFCSGQLPTEAGTLKCRGRVGAEVTEDEAYDAARTAALNALAAIKSVIGDLDRITRVVRVTGYVNSAMGFTNQPTVVDGASDFLVKLFGEAGQHSRVSVGVFQLPRDAPVEVDMVVEVAE